jgi:hypothetical protein
MKKSVAWWRYNPIYQKPTSFEPIAPWSWFYYYGPDPAAGISYGCYYSSEEKVKIIHPINQKVFSPFTGEPISLREEIDRQKVESFLKKSHAASDIVECEKCKAKFIGQSSRTANYCISCGTQIIGEDSMSLKTKVVAKLEAERKRARLARARAKVKAEAEKKALSEEEYVSVEDILKEMKADEKKARKPKKEMDLDSFAESSLEDFLEVEPEEQHEEEAHEEEKEEQHEEEAHEEHDHEMLEVREDEFYIPEHEEMPEPAMDYSADLSQPLEQAAEEDVEKALAKKHKAKASAWRRLTSAQFQTTAKSLRVKASAGEWYSLMRGSKPVVMVKVEGKTVTDCKTEGNKPCSEALTKEVVAFMVERKLKPAAHLYRVKAEPEAVEEEMIHIDELIEMLEKKKEEDEEYVALEDLVEELEEKEEEEEEHEEEPAEEAEKEDEHEEEAHEEEKAFISDEMKAESMKFEPVASLASLNKAGKNNIDMILFNETSENPFWNITVAGIPAARVCLASQDNPEDIKEVFCSEGYAKELMGHCGKVGFMSAMKQVRAQFWATTDTNAERAERMKAQAQASLENERREYLSSYKRDFLHCLSIAIAGINKNFYPDLGNPLKDTLFSNLRLAGLSEATAQSVIEKSFKEGAAPYFDALITKATEYMSLPKEAKAEISKAIASSDLVAALNDNPLDNFAADLGERLAQASVMPSMLANQGGLSVTSSVSVDSESYKNRLKSAWVPRRS